MDLKGRMSDCKVGSQEARSHQPGAAEVGRQRGPQGQCPQRGGGGSRGEAMGCGLTLRPASPF